MKKMLYLWLSSTKGMTRFSIIRSLFYQAKLIMHNSSHLNKECDLIRINPNEKL